MTNRQAAEKEWADVKAWAIDEEEKVAQNLQASGVYCGGLDTNQEAFAYIREATNRRLKEIQEKYSQVAAG